jgi:hypothetical protein
MCATVSWGAHESFMHPIFVLKNGCDIYENNKKMYQLWTYILTLCSNCVSGEMTNTKAVDLDKFYNFFVDNFFACNYLLSR